MYEIGRLCVKVAGRDARQKCVIIEVLGNNLVMIDGQTRRRKCNIKHLEPLDKVLKIKKKASHKDVVAALKKEGIEVVDTKLKPKKEKPANKRKSKKKSSEPEKKPKKSKKKKTKKSKKKKSSKKSSKKKSKKKSTTKKK